MVEYLDLGVVWYAMKTTFKRELKALSYLESCGVEGFIPMEKSLLAKGGKRVVCLKPAIHNLIFIKADIHELRRLKSALPYLHNRLVESEETLRPIVVPTLEMEQFIHATQLLQDSIHYVDLSVSRLERGTPVRITGGDFQGYQGKLAKIKGKRDRRVTINISGILAYRIDVCATLIERL